MGQWRYIDGQTEQSLTQCSQLLPGSNPFGARRGLPRELVRVTVCKIVAETKSIKILSWLNEMRGAFTYS